MMNPLRVYGENFCQYRSFDEKLPPGLICLLGMNGSGKSNFVRAAYLCLVGEVYGTPNLVRIGQKKGFVGMDAEVEQGVFTILRKLTHNQKTGGTKIQHELSASWLEQPLKKKADVAAFLAPLIGVPIPTLQHVSFALQGKFGSLMTCDHTPRAKMINTFMGLERAEKLRLIIKGSIDTIADMPDRTEAMNMAESDLDLYGKEVIQAEADLQAAQSEITEAVETAYQNAAQIRNMPSAEVRDAEHVKYQGLLESWLAELKKAEETLAQIPAVGEISPPDSDDKYNHQRYLDAVASLEQARKTLQELKDKPKPEPAKDEDRALLSDEKATERNELLAEVFALKAQIDSFGTGVCPTCNQELKVDFNIEQVTKEYTEKQKKHEKLKDLINVAAVVVNEANNRVETYERQLKNYTNMVPIAEEKLKELEKYADFDPEQYDKSVQEYEQALAQSANRTRALQEKSKCELEVQRAHAQLNMLETQKVATQTEKQQAEALITGYLAAKDAIKTATNHKYHKESQFRACEARIKTLKEDMSRGEANIKATELLQQAKEKLHVEQLPRLAAQSRINAINRKMKKYLDMFAFPYGFRLDENLDFVVDLDTPGHPSEILSGGEEVRAAMAMRFALMDVFSAGCGLLIIDEPTTALDTDAVTALVEVLGVAAAYFKKRNIKILCPTHALQLMAVADTTITIGE